MLVVDKDASLSWRRDCRPIPRARLEFGDRRATAGEDEMPILGIHRELPPSRNITLPCVKTAYHWRLTVRVRSSAGSLSDFRVWKSSWTMPRVFSGYSRFPRPYIPAPLHHRVSFHVMFRDDGHLRVPAGKPVIRRVLPRPGAALSHRSVPHSPSPCGAQCVPPIPAYLLRMRLALPERTKKYGSPYYLSADSTSVALGWSGAGMLVRVRRGYPEKGRHVASSSAIPTCEGPGVDPPGIEPGSPWWKASALATAPPLPHFIHD
ncbi:hypothetical protein PR048_016748 [Dryococelus australis]|uniref:Uncharacterized protein n=1 Tax=Dryococelus australis TaxID=614101 RepID=A0ABQ9H7N5_9NEOP|nr:hypothetical protein PR048_016748 [Dryococelus australis]